MDWQTITFTTHEVAFGALDKILNELMDFFLKTNISIEEVGVFVSKQRNKEISLFFTPNAAITFSGVIASYQHSLCDKPTNDESYWLLFGDRSSWHLIE